MPYSVNHVPNLFCKLCYQFVPNPPPLFHKEGVRGSSVQYHCGNERSERRSDLLKTEFYLQEEFAQLEGTTRGYAQIEGIRVAPAEVMISTGPLLTPRPNDSAKLISAVVVLGKIFRTTNSFPGT